MINNKALVCSYVAKIFADGTKYHESIKESDNIGYIYDAVEELLNTKLSKQERKELPLDVQIIRLTERTKDDYDAQLIIAAYLLMTVAPQLWTSTKSVSSIKFVEKTEFILFLLLYLQPLQQIIH